MIIVQFPYCNTCKMFAEGNLYRRKTGPLFETYTSITNFAKELHGAPPENFVTELAEAVGSLRTLKKMALFWSRVVEEVSFPLVI